MGVIALLRVQTLSNHARETVAIVGLGVQTGD